MNRASGVILARRGRVARALMAAGLALGLATLFLLNPQDLSVVSCPFRDLTGNSCLTCGLTRSLHTMARGDLLASLQFHAMGPVVFAGLLLAAIVWAAEGFAGRRIRLNVSARRRYYGILFFSILWIGYCVVRLIIELTY